MTTTSSRARPVEPGRLLGGPEHRTVLRLLAWMAAIQRASRQHPRIRQWAAPLVCAALGVPGLLDSVAGADPGLPVALMVMIGFTVPLLARDRHPFLVFAVVTTFSMAEAASGVLTYAHFLAQLIMLYNLARFAPPLQLAVAVAVAVPQTIVTIMMFAPDRRIERIDSPLAVTTDLVLCILATAGLGLAGRVARSYIAALEDQAVRLELERDQRARLAEATERARISREMHDVLGHTLAVVVGLADGAAGLAETRPKQSADTLRIIADSGRGALADLRRLITGSREEGPHKTPFRPQPGVGDLGALLERIRAAGPDVGLHTAGDLTGLPAGLQLAVYRIVQEALTNTLEHAASDTTVRVSLIAEHDAVHITVEDTALRPRDHLREGGGQGLLGMRERAVLYQGTVTAGPDSAGGWSVRAVLRPTPLTKTGPDAQPA
ncbi:sensor histidine kinase [Streptomyces viridochromogenes]|uniref:sensor histidine kinase n=1 Tax=Streptomyces viridochromogenes TaxID=1938 RepID=UPI00069EAD19|nr:histidine kinase [Streptomyces viridochromogenes]KOG08840.1 histidine kinase [Streptomyces viridochromogenes]KOG09590.1 histidine kinase [Streptomyces viridochromogenes]